MLPRRGACSHTRQAHRVAQPEGWVSPSPQPYLEEEVEEGQATPLATWDAGAGSIPSRWHWSMGPQHLLVPQPPQGAGVLVVVGILQVLEVRRPPDDGSQGAVGVAVGQEVAGEAPGHGG